MTIPLVGGVPLDVDDTWRYLREVADFFAVPMPSVAELSSAIAAFRMTVGAAPVAADVTIATAGGAPQIFVTGAAVRPRRAAVRVTVDDAVPHAHTASDPWWRRMAARTTSRGDVDQRARWLAGRGFADCVTGGVPHLGALVFESGGGQLVGVDNPEPTSILAQLEQCGAVSGIDRVEAVPTGPQRAWWISPRYELHPVAELDGVRLPFDFTSSAPFGRWA